MMSHDIPYEKIATHWSIREVHPGATTVVTAEFCLVEPRVKTGLNVPNNGACQRLNSKRMYSGKTARRTLPSTQRH